MLINLTIPIINNAIQLDFLLQNKVVFQQDPVPFRHIVPVQWLLNKTCLTPLGIFSMGMVEFKRVADATVDNLRKKSI